MALTDFVAGQVLTAQQLDDSFAAVDWNENVIINGAMQVAQRATSVTGITTSGYRTADRWNFDITSLGTWTQTVENDAPTGSGFRTSLKMLCTTADAAPSASDFALIEQRLEGQNIQQFAKGTAAAKTFVLSFWVKSNVTGTYIANLYDNDNARSVSATYTVTASATWEKKTITFPADTTGAIDNDSALSFNVQFWLGAGTTFTSGTLNTTWAAVNNANRVVGQTNLASAINNYWQITGVQLQPERASQFAFLNYGTVLSQCQRYYYVFTCGIGGVSGFADTTSVGLFYLTYPPMRASATATLTATDFEMRRSGTSSTAGSTVSTAGGVSSARIDLTGVSASLTAGQGLGLAAVSGTKEIKLSAEL